jgi:hypothetical protein
MKTPAVLRVCQARLRGAIGPGSDEGTSLVEAVVATTLLLILMAGVMSLGAIALTTTENQGHLAARTTEYAQDKMEQLLALAYGDTTSDTRLFPAPNSGGTGLTVGGSSNPSAPVASYVDYLDQSGNLLASAGTAAPAGWFYKRVWQIQNPSANLKLITVTVTVAWGFGSAAPARSTVAALKSFPF